ncbi:MAG: IclR family transcriptional regulator [Pusillimonas sp.]
MPKSRLPADDVDLTSKIDRQFVTALARGINILRCFTEKRFELSTAEIANLTGLPQPTAWRLCYTLVKCGFLISMPSNDKMRLGMPVLSLGLSALSMANFGEVVQQEMQQLAIDFHAAVSIAVPDRLDMLILKRARSDGMLLVNLHVGSRLPMATSSLGWAYAASLPKQERDVLLEQLAAAHGSDWPVLYRHMQAAITEFEQCGYVINSSHYHPEINAIAVPIMGKQTKDTMVITCGGPATLVQVSQLSGEVAPRLIELANTIRAVNASAGAEGLPWVR